jgi:hypothetical protein
MTTPSPPSTPAAGAPALESGSSLLLRPATERFHSRHDWLDSRHSFSFAGHDDPAWRGFGPLRVINEDHIAAGRGFGMHPHSDMEIVTVMLSGVLHHRDSLGHSAELRAGEVQRMSAGTGIVHSEINGGATCCRSGSSRAGAASPPPTTRRPSPSEPAGRRWSIPMAQLAPWRSSGRCGSGGAIPPWPPPSTFQAIALPTAGFR